MRRELGIENLEIFQLQLYKFLKELGFVNNPKSYDDYKNVADSEKDSTDLRGLKNMSYKPKSETTEKPLNSEGIDSEVFRYLKEIKQ